MRTLTVEREINIPKNTQKTSPLRMEVPVGEGLVVQTRVTFPPGPAGYAGVKLRVGGTQVVPQRLTEWLIGDDITYTYSVPVNLFQSSGFVICEAYNEDEVYDHTVILTFELIHAEKTPEELLAEVVSSNLNLKLSDLQECLKQVLAALVELRGTVQQGFEEQLKRYLQQQQEQLLRKLRELPIEELANI